MESCELSIRVIPNASRNEIVGWLESALKVKVQAPAESGKANQAVIDLLAKSLSLKKKAITILKGTTQQNKLIQLAGISLDELHLKLKTLS